MGQGRMRMHRTGNTKTRSQAAIDAQFRTSAGAMGKRGKGRDKRDDRTRSQVKHLIRAGVEA